jgi:hypothetical protein
MKEKGSRLEDVHNATREKERRDREEGGRT